MTIGRKYFNTSIYRTFSSLVILLLLVTACESPRENQLEQEMTSTNPRIAVDVGVVVSDINRALEFYRDVLGLEVVAEVRTSLIGKGTMVQVKHGTSLIKLLEMDTSPGVTREAGITAAYGYRYITLMVPNMESVLTAIDEHEITVTLPLTELGNGAKIIMIEDPDGNIVEFVEEV